MPDTVLVPLDGSPLAERALRYALETFPKASHTAIHVIDPVDSITATEAGGLPDAEQWYENAQEESTAIHDAASAIASEYETELATVTEVGRPARAILDYADGHGIDQIVMGSHGREGLERVFLGSVAETVIRRSGGAVTVVR